MTAELYLCPRRAHWQGFVILKAGVGPPTPPGLPGFKLFKDRLSLNLFGPP